MSGKTAAEALREHVRSLQRSVSCVTDRVIRAAGPLASGTEIAVVLANNQPVRLSGGTFSLAIRVAQWCIPVERPSRPLSDRWSIAEHAYAYRLEVAGTEEEILAFHLHPHVIGKEYPHLHLGQALGARPPFVNLHVPTGPITLTDVLLLAIEELGVTPRRTDWRSVLVRPPGDAAS